MKNKKRIGLLLDEELFYKVKKEADTRHIPLATAIKLILVEKLGGNDNGAK